MLGLGRPYKAIKLQSKKPIQQRRQATNTARVVLSLETTEALMRTNMHKNLLNNKVLVVACSSCHNLHLVITIQLFVLSAASIVFEK